MKTIMIIIASLFFTIGVWGQTYYYNTSRIFNENGYSYRCNTTDWGEVTLGNVDNIYTESDYVYKDGSPITDFNILRGFIKLIDDDNWTRQTCLSIVNNAFSTTEKQRVVGGLFDVSMTIDTQTGRVIEVDFRFLKDEPFATIPVSTYHKIEQDLKNQIWFTLTDAGKQLKFIQRGWMHEVE